MNPLNKPDAIRLLKDRHERLYNDIESPQRLEVRPYTDTKGFADSYEFLKDLLDETGTGRKAATFSWEWWFRDQLTIQFTGPDLADLQDLINSEYPNSRMETYNDPLPESEVGEYATIARISQSADSLFPCAFEGADGRAGRLDGDPHQSFLPRLVNENGVRLVLQGCFSPVRSRWHKRGFFGDSGSQIATYYKMYDDTFNEDLGEDIEKHIGQPAMRTTIRILGIGPDPDDTQAAVENAANAFSKFKYGEQQTLEPKYYKGCDIIREAEEVVRRRLALQNAISRFRNGPSNVMTIDEFRGPFHFPNDSINVPDVKWITRESGPGVPRQSEQFDENMEIPDVPAGNDADETEPEAI